MSYVGVEWGCKYTLTGPDGTVAVFNDDTSPYYVGMLNAESSGLDGSEVREDSADRVEADGAIHGPFFAGRRPVILNGTIDNGGSAATRNERVGRLLAAAKALREDAILTWKPQGATEELQVRLRQQQPTRITKGFVKDFQVAMVAADSSIYGTTVVKDEFSGRSASITGTSGGLANDVVSNGTYVYFTRDSSPSTIGRVKVDGTEKNLEFIKLSAADFMYGIATDGTYLYWTRNLAGVGYVSRAKVDGTSVEEKWLKTEGTLVAGIDCDSTYLYIVQQTSGYVMRAKLDGTELNKTWVKAYDTSAANDDVFGVSVDATHVYWTMKQSGKIGKAKLDGTEVNAKFFSEPTWLTESTYGILAKDGYLYVATVLSLARLKTDGTDFILKYGFDSGAVGVDYFGNTIYVGGLGALYKKDFYHEITNPGSGETYPVIRLSGLPTTTDRWIEYNGSRLFIDINTETESWGENDEIIIDTYAGTVVYKGADFYSHLSYPLSFNWFQPLPGGASQMIIGNASKVTVEYVPAYV